ncbi:MAG: DsbA family protein [Alphaproteobacteria bacterium]|nr:DsbA family protein [Alphaproteobacteria bacterium]
MRRFLLTFLMLAGLSAPALAEDFSREQIDQFIHEYLMKNPQVVIDSVNEYGKKQQEAENKKSEDAVKANMNWLVSNTKHAEAGNPKGDVTIVEFFDYNCGYCKQALSDLMSIIDSDKNVRLVFIEIPILGQSSFEAARWALAAKNQKMYLEYHVALMRHRGAFDENILADYAKKVGLDVEKLKKDKSDPIIDAILQENLRMSTDFGISGTPAFVVGTKLIRGYISGDEMRQAVVDARKAKN